MLTILGILLIIIGLLSLIIKPSLGIDYQITNTLSLRSSTGYVKAKGGKLSSTFLNFGIKYNISLLKLK